MTEGKKVRIALSADWHFSDNNPAFFQIFDVICRYIEQTNIQHFFFLGDLTDAKDNHSSYLVNEVVKGFKKILNALPQSGRIYIVKGNHDAYDLDMPYFEFLGELPGITYISQPRILKINSTSILMQPYVKNTDDFLVKAFDDVDIVCMHQPAIGVVTGSGHEIEKGLSKDFFRGYEFLTISGDIHKPMEHDMLTSTINYLGSPYSTRHGEHHAGRIGRLTIGKDDKDYALHFKDVKRITRQHLFPTKWSFSIKPEDISEKIFENKFIRGDSVNIIINAKKKDLPFREEWNKDISKFLKSKGVTLNSFTVKCADKGKLTKTKTKKKKNDKDRIISYAKKEKLSKKQAKLGLEVISNDI